MFAAESFEYVIVSRHPAAIEFIRAEMPAAADAPVLASATPADVANRIVVGNVPLHLAAAARGVFAVEFAGDAPRGTEYGIEAMRAAGARLVGYVVFRADTPGAMESAAVAMQHA